MSDFLIAEIVSVIYRTIVMGTGLALAYMGYQLLKNAPAAARQEQDTAGKATPTEPASVLSDLEASLKKITVRLERVPQGTLLVVAGVFVVCISLIYRPEIRNKVTEVTMPPAPAEASHKSQDQPSMPERKERAR